MKWLLSVIILCSACMSTNTETAFSEFNIASIGYDVCINSFKRNFVRDYDSELQTSIRGPIASNVQIEIDNTPVSDKDLQIYLSDAGVGFANVCFNVENFDDGSHDVRVIILENESVHTLLEWVIVIDSNSTFIRLGSTSESP